MAQDIVLSHFTPSQEHYDIVIVGSGPSGLSAAVRATELELNYLVLEAEEAPASTIRKYQRGKHVMAEPRALPLHGSLPFSPAKREAVLESWEHLIDELGIQIRYEARVTGLRRMQDEFEITLADGEVLTAGHVVLAIGVQGNLRKLEIPGGELPQVQYQLDDPEAYQGETIVVVGGGDSGVENAVALAARNQVIIVNRSEDFSNCKDSNVTQLTEARLKGSLDWLLETRLQAIERGGKEGFPVTVVAGTPNGIERIPCHRVIARLGALPPRPQLESFGITFPTDDPAALPLLSPRYESSVPGLFVIGALAGYPLIKQGINQGYEVIEHILGNPVEPADAPQLRAKFAHVCEGCAVEEVLEKIQKSVPLLSLLSPLQLRELILESEILLPRPGDIIFRRNDYSSSFFSVVEGELEVLIEQDEKVDVVISSGQFFGEMGLISGRRRSATVRARTPCMLVESPRRTMQKLIESVQAMRRMLDEVAIKRAVRGCIGVSLSENDLDDLSRTATLKEFAAGEEIFHEGDEADGLYLIRSGSVTVSRMIGGKEVVLFYVAAGNYFGEMSLVSGKARYATVRAAVATEAILLEAARMREVIAHNPEVRNALDDRYLQHLQEQEIRQQLETADHHHASGQPSSPSNLISFLIQQGVGEATDVLLIDEALCVRCNYCEQACADTHGGTSRLDRDTGPIFANIRVPASCRHCEHPHCMKDCPPDAIHRAPHGEVYIDDSCIGCGNCQKNCPYDVIQMAVLEQDRPERSLWQILLGVHPKAEAPVDGPKVAVKCDMCKDITGGPVCVRACPVGAALRVNPEALLGYAGGGAAEAGLLGHEH